MNFRKRKTAQKALVFRWISILFLIVGICFIGYTIKAIFFQPDYTIKAEHDDDFNSEPLNILFKEIAVAYEKSTVSNVKTDLLAVDSKEIPPLFIGVPYEKGAYIGELVIPSLNYELPIYEGTDSSELKKGVGRYIGSALPGEADNCVLSGHRDTVFSKLGDLKIGEKLIIKSDLGDFVYKVNAIRIVDEDDRTVLVHYEKAILTLTTCYPFNYIGPAPQRYIVSAEMINININTKILPGKTLEIKPVAE